MSDVSETEMALRIAQIEATIWSAAYAFWAKQYGDELDQSERHDFAVGCADAAVADFMNANEFTMAQYARKL